MNGYCVQQILKCKITELYEGQKMPYSITKVSGLFPFTQKVKAILFVIVEAMRIYWVRVNNSG